MSRMSAAMKWTASRKKSLRNRLNSHEAHSKALFQKGTLSSNTMRTPHPQYRFSAVSMELTAYLDEHRVDMLVVASDGTTVAIECENNSILNIQQHIDAIVEACPEIATWSRTLKARPRADLPDELSRETAAALDAAVSEGWPAEQPDRSPLQIPHLASA